MAAGDWKELYLSAQNGNLEIVKYHIITGVDPNYQHPEFMTTPLIVCIEEEHFEIAKYLLENGANPSTKEIFGHHTPLSMAKSKKNLELINLVEEYLKKD